MAIVKNPSFDWLRSEVDLIKSKRFHIFTPLTVSNLLYEKEGVKFALNGDYADFLAEFGWANLFADHSDAPVVIIYPLKSYREVICEDGRTYLGFGDRGNQHVCFDEGAILRGEQSKVYSVAGRKATVLYPGFSEWLIAAYDWAKSKYSQKQWNRIVDGPKPFSLEEMRVVEARRLFRWKLIGFAEDGDALFEVENCSRMALPFLTIGIRDIQQRILTGGVWLNVGHIEPGAKAVVKKDCYKDRIPADQLEAFDRPDPIPEKKAAYWEFGN